MKLKLLTAAAAAAIMVVPTVAQADDFDDEGWYLRGNVGYGIHTDTDLTGDLIGDVESEGNVAWSLGVGYDFGDNWRLEVDGTSLWTDLGAISQVPSSFAKARTNSLFLNAIYDFDEFGQWEPYVGAGVGLVQADFTAEAHDFFNGEGTGVISNPVCSGALCAFDQQDVGLGWQILAGIGYDVTDRLTWDTHYKYTDSTDFDIDGLLQQTAFAATSAANTEVDGLDSHTLLTGFRYKLSSPAPKVTCWNGDVVNLIGDCPAQPRIITCWDSSSYEEGSGGSCPPEPEPVRYTTCWDGSSFEEGTATCPPEPVTYTCWNGDIVSDLAVCPPQLSDRGNNLAQLCSNEYRQEVIYYEFDKGQSPETRATINRILDIGEFCQVDNIRVVGHTEKLSRLFQLETVLRNS